MRFSVNVSCVASAAKETMIVPGGFRSKSFPMASMKLLSLKQEACATTRVLGRPSTDHRRLSSPRLPCDLLCVSHTDAGQRRPRLETVWIYSAPTMLTTLTCLIFPRLSSNKTRITKWSDGVACLFLRLLLHPPQSLRRTSFSHHVCCEEVLLLRALARMRQIVAPLRLRNLLVRHNGEAALRLVRNTCNLVPIEVIGITIPSRRRYSKHKFQK